MTRGIFITGTDTGVGKTVVTAGLVRLAADRRQRVVGLKPVASGAVRTPEGLRNEDAMALAAAGNVPLPYGLINPFCFEPAIAPHLAAADAGVRLPVSDLLEWYGRASGDADLACVEGAGGVIAPIAGPLFREHLLAFELTSILLLAAIVGAVVIGKKQGPADAR